MTRAEGALFIGAPIGAALVLIGFCAILYVLSLVSPALALAAVVVLAAFIFKRNQEIKA